ncbi:glycosyltransferase [Serinicoccus marinus]|uniref:glycosyltransferase n=1 Tax=Serinicoccus marinus TaxID=247333 RepID=UPI00146D74C1|nr:glycosyltransferase [Serinicoccus marinus]
MATERLRPGSAAEVHFKAIAEGVSEQGTAWTRRSTSATRWPALRLVAAQLVHLRRAIWSDVCYVRWHPLDVWLLACRWILRVPYVLEVNGTQEDLYISHSSLRRFSRLMDSIVALQIREAAAVVAVSPGLRDWARGIKGRRKEPVGWAPNGAVVTVAPTEMVHPPYVVYVGELAPWQGLELLLAAKESSCWPEGVALHVAGSGQMEPLLREAASQGQVVWHGRLPREDALGLLSRAAVSVSPQSKQFDRNLHMGRPLKIAESLLLGVPVVLTDFGADSRLVASLPGCRLLTEEDPDLLAVNIAAVLDGATPGQRAALASEAGEVASWHPAIELAWTLIRQVTSH